MCASERALYMPLKESSPSVGTQFVKNRQISASCVARGRYLRGVLLHAPCMSPIARALSKSVVSNEITQNVMS